MRVSIGSLQIQQSLESDEGKYECVAENRVGVAYSYGANLYVRGTFDVRGTFRPSSVIQVLGLRIRFLAVGAFCFRGFCEKECLSASMIIMLSCRRETALLGAL